VVIGLQKNGLSTFKQHNPEKTKQF
jgi:hypothetical protein